MARLTSSPNSPPSGASAFLERAGWGNAVVSPLAGDASFRRYFRVVDGLRQAILMDAPPPHEDAKPFIAVAQGISAQGFNAPKIYAADADVGLLLLEDFGATRMREAIDTAPALEASLYNDVVTLLVDLHRQPPLALARYDMAVYLREIALLTDYYCPALGLAVDVQAFDKAWEAALSMVLASAAQVTTLRDYHSENIMLLANKTGTARLGLLDFQDALVGHPAYDLVSMLQDARRDVSPDLEIAMLQHYHALAAPDDMFDACYHILGAQRNTKILGIFTRLWRRDNKPHYLEFLPRVWGYLERDLAHPALAPIKAWFDANIPAEMRTAALRNDAV